MASPLAKTHTTFQETTAPGIGLMKACVQIAISDLASMPRDIHELDRLLGSASHLAEDPIAAQRRRDLLLEHSPLKPAVHRISAEGQSPSQTFVRLMDQGVVQRLIKCERILSEHLAQAVSQRRAGRVSESAALMGLVLRTALAGGLESLVVRSSVQLSALLMQSPHCVKVSMTESRLETLRKAWRIWGTQSPEQDAETQERLAHVLRRKVDEAADEPTLDEVAVLERLLSQPGQASPGHLSRAALRLMELYATAQLACPESSFRGMDLMVRWAKASALRATPPPRS